MTDPTGLGQHTNAILAELDAKTDENRDQGST